MEKRGHMFIHERTDHEAKSSTSRSFSNGNASSNVVFDRNSKEGSDFCKRVIRDRKPGTESSCSNSTHVVRPVASSNDSYQEISTEAKSSEHHNGGSSISLPTDSRCCIDEPVTSHEVSGTSPQITQKGVFVTGVRDYLKVSATTTDGLSQMKKENSSISYESVMTIAEDVATKAYGFDLNEDIHNNNFDSCSSVIHVVARSGVPRHIPIAPLKFEGAHGWKGSAATSAFRPTRSRRFSGFDLNVASEEDNALKIDSNRAERPCFDLNSLGDTTQEFLPVSKTPVADFNLNEDPEISRDHNLTFGRPVYWTDLNPVQFFGHTQARPLLMAAPNMVQPMEQMQKLPYVMQTLPSSGPFFIGSNESLSSSVPYARDPRVHTGFPQIMNHGTLPSFHGTTTPHLMQVVHVQSPSEVTSSNAVNGNMRDYTRQYLSPGKSSTPDEQIKPFHQQMKRREPDGGWNSFQIGTRQFTSWN